MYGVLIAPLMLAGVVAVRRDRTVVALQLAAIGHVVLLSMTTQAQPRFVYLATVLLVILGTDVVVRAVHACARRTQIVAAICAAAAVCAVWANIQRTQLGRDREARIEGNARTFVAAEILRADRNPARPCEVVVSGDRTRLEWYSGCAALISPQRADAQLYEIRDGTTTALPDGATRIAYLPAFIDMIRMTP